MSENSNNNSASEQIEFIINKHSGWKGELLAKLRKIILSANPNLVEEIKWKMPTRPEGLPVWTYKGIVCFAEIWKDNIKLIFYYGAEIEDPRKLFNSRLKSSQNRAIEYKEGSNIDETGLRELVDIAVRFNDSK